MSLQWTNKHKTSQDLHEAQGTIPVDINNTIYTKGKPLNQSLFAEHDVMHSYDDVEFESGPDLQLIKKMLDMVRERNSSHDIFSIDAESMFQICKIDTSQKTDNKIIMDKVKMPKVRERNSSHDIFSVNAESMFQICKIDSSQKTDNKIIIDKVKIPKVRRQRNVALASILEAISTQNSMDSKLDENTDTASVQKTDTHMKLLKPEDFIMKDEPNESMEAVCSIVDISSPNATSVILKNNNQRTELKTFDNYKPSARADLYYKNYLEKNKLKNMHHNFMHETEKLIKIVDLKEPEMLCLTQHRHLLTEECIVCKLLCKKHI